MSKKLNSQLINYFTSVLTWMFVVFLFAIIRFLDNSANLAWGTQLIDFVKVGTLAGIAMGTISWASIIIIEKTGLRKKSYFLLILIQLGVIFFAAAIIILLVITYMWVNEKTDTALPLIDTFESVIRLGNLSFITALIVASVILSLLQVMKSIIGGKVLFNLMIGKYIVPMQEKKVFMFIDMQSSTTIAEKIGHEAFSRFIQDCFSDLSESVTRYNAEIYKYIGDEAIITWDYELAKNGDPLNLFFHFNDTLKKRGDYYTKNYGTIPFFKAGLNAGEVSTLEVGVIKKEIAHLSDVLNTAARIQGKCNSLNAAILVSEEVKEMIPESSELSYEYKDDLLLRGKEQKVKVYEVKLKA
ncbi:MAG: adenylate/guanylate cyclase domain-containing protein [Lentimicrobium sp.]